MPMKKRKYSWASIIWCAVLIILGAYGGVILATHPIIGSILIVGGVVGAIWSIISVELQNRNLQNDMDVYTDLLIKGGIGNIHLERFRNDLRNDGRSSRALEHLTTAYEADPINGEAAAALAAVLTIEISFQNSVEQKIIPENLQRAKEVTARALTLAPELPSPYSASGIICDLEGKHKEAREWFRKARDKGDPLWQIELCISYGMDGRFPEALREIEQAVAKCDSENWLIHYLHGKCLVNVGRYAEALTPLMLAFDLRGLRHELILAISESLYMQGRFLPSAFYSCLEAVSLWPANKRRGLLLVSQAARSGLIFIITRLSRYLLRLTRNVKPLLKLHYAYLPAPYEPEAQLALMAVKRGHMAAANILLDQAIAIAPDVAVLWGNKATVLAMERKYDEAITAYDRALNYDPGNLAWEHSREQITLLKEGKITRIQPRFA